MNYRKGMTIIPDDFEIIIRKKESGALAGKPPGNPGRTPKTNAGEILKGVLKPGPDILKDL